MYCYTIEIGEQYIFPVFKLCVSIGERHVSMSMNCI